MFLKRIVMAVILTVTVGAATSKALQRFDDPTDCPTYPVCDGDIHRG